MPPCPRGRSKDASTSCLHPPTPRRIPVAAGRTDPPALGAPAVKTVPAHHVPASSTRHRFDHHLFQRVLPGGRHPPAACSPPARSPRAFPSDGATTRDGNASRGSDRPRQGDRRPSRSDAPRTDSRRSDAPRGERSRTDGSPGARNDGGQRPTDQSRNPRGRGGRRNAAADDRSPVVFAAHAPRTYDRPAGETTAVRRRIAVRRHQDRDRRRRPDVGHQLPRAGRAGKADQAARRARRHLAVPDPGGDACRSR